MIYGFGIEMCSVLWVKEKQELEEDLEDGGDGSGGPI